ncbi:MAG: cupin domain-containing protein [Rhabdochlamydiaceae bacterium]|nr:cupin domain-containing protein [Rhabdochlamydiaceae bacterium]
MTNANRNNTSLKPKDASTPCNPLLHPFPPLLAFLTFAIGCTAIDAKEIQQDYPALVIEQVVEQAKKNTNWKTALATAKHEQVVFMNISPVTNPKNEIGLEVHAFDQVILVVQGEGKAVLNGKIATVKEGDMIFVPEGISHNLINTDKKKELKIISFYSDRDIPKDAAYKKKADQPED